MNELSKEHIKDLCNKIKNEQFKINSSTLDSFMLLKDNINESIMSFQEMKKSIKKANKIMGVNKLSQCDNTIKPKSIKINQKSNNKSTSNSKNKQNVR